LGIKKAFVVHEQVGMMLSGMGYQSPDVFSQVHNQHNCLDGTMALE
jgi:hypothetical protein